MPIRKPITTISIGALLLFSGVAFPQPGNIYTFFPDVEITDAPSNDGNALFESSGQHYTAFRGDTVYVVWHENRVVTPPVGGWILFAKSTDCGQTFGPAVPVAEGINPSMKMDTAGNIYVAYTHFGYIYFSKSTDGGNTFTFPVLVTDSAGLDYYQEKPAIAVNNKGQVFVAWIDGRTAGPNDPPEAVFAAASYDNGATFTSNVQVNDSITPSGGYIDIGSGDNGLVYIVWTPYAGPLFLSRSSDSGQTYPFRTIAGNQYTFSPSIAVDSACIGVVWENLEILNDSLYLTLHFSVSQDYGQTFSPSVRVDDDSDLTGLTAPHTPSLVYEKGVFYVIWWGNKRVFFSYSADNGQSFAPSVLANSGLYVAMWPSLAVNEEGNAFVVWLDGRYDPGGLGFRHIFGSRGTPDYAKGDLNLDGMLTAVDLVMLTNATFLGQTFPAPFESADSNCDSLLNGPDVILLLNATFLGNPFPCNV